MKSGSVEGWLSDQAQNITDSEECKDIGWNVQEMCYKETEQASWPKNCLRITWASNLLVGS